jgi:hypothetical protein
MMNFGHRKMTCSVDDFTEYEGGATASIAAAKDLHENALFVSNSVKRKRGIAVQSLEASSATFAPAKDPSCIASGTCYRTKDC